MNTATMSQGGRVVVPKVYREELGIKDGDEVIWTEIDGLVVLTSRRRQIERAQALCAQLFDTHPDQSLVDELITERRAEAAQDDIECAEFSAKFAKKFET